MENERLPDLASKDTFAAIESLKKAFEKIRLQIPSLVPKQPLMFETIHRRRFGATLKHIGYSVGLWEHPNGYSVSLVKHNPEISKSGCRGIFREVITSASEAAQLFYTIAGNPLVFNDQI